MHLISLDFSKAYDMVRHSTLVLKLADLPLPSYIHNWFVEWLTNRKHCTKFQGDISPMLVINASMIQGLGIGPVAFVIDASDLHACHDGNIFSKYADDMHILIPPCNSPTIAFVIIIQLYMHCSGSYFTPLHLLKINIQIKLFK